MNKYKFMLAVPLALLLGCQQPSTAAEPETSQLQVVPVNDSKIAVYTTAKDTDLRLTLSQELRFKPGTQATEGEVSIFVNPNKRFQKILGIGGAITDASAEVFAKLPADKQNEMLRAYYDEEAGIGYTLARTSIHSSDFGSGSHTYIEEGDKALSTFNIDHDREFRIPLIKRATQAAGGSLTLYASLYEDQQ